MPVPNGTSLPGVGLARTLFAVALLASGQNSTLSGTLAGQIVMEGFLNFRMQPWLRPLIAVVPAVAVFGYYREIRTTDLLIWSHGEEAGDRQTTGGFRSLGRSPGLG